MWKSIMNLWYKIWGQEKNDIFGSNCPKKKIRRKRNNLSNEQIAPDGKPIITRERFEKLEKQIEQLSPSRKKRAPRRESVKKAINKRRSDI